MLKAIKNQMKFAGICSRSYQFSVTFMQSKHTIFPYDNSVRDIQADDLKNQISVKLNKKYLSPLSQNEKQVEQKRTGIIYGVSNRGMISIPTRFFQKNPIWIHYLIFAGSPSTYLTQEAMHALIGPSPQKIGQIIAATINGLTITVNRSSHNFKDVNILGMDYLILRKSLVYHLAGKEQKCYLEIQFRAKKSFDSFNIIILINLGAVRVNMIIRGPAIIAPSTPCDVKYSFHKFALYINVVQIDSQFILIDQFIILEQDSWREESSGQIQVKHQFHRKLQQHLRIRWEFKQKLGYS